MPTLWICLMPWLAFGCWLNYFSPFPFFFFFLLLASTVLIFSSLLFLWRHHNGILQPILLYPKTTQVGEPKLQALWGPLQNAIVLLYQLREMEPLKWIPYGSPGGSKTNLTPTWRQIRKTRCLLPDHHNVVPSDEHTYWSAYLGFRVSQRQRDL